MAQTANGLTGNLTLTGQGPNLYGPDINPLRVRTPPSMCIFAELISTLLDGRVHGNSCVRMELQCINADDGSFSETRLHVKIYDPVNARWEVPQSLLPRTPPSTKPAVMDYAFSYTSNPFGFAVQRGTEIPALVQCLLAHLAPS